jgi:hypothetical protein
MYVIDVIYNMVMPFKDCQYLRYVIVTEVSFLVNVIRRNLYHLRNPLMFMSQSYKIAYTMRSCQIAGSHWCILSVLIGTLASFNVLLLLHRVTTGNHSTVLLTLTVRSSLAVAR